MFERVIFKDGNARWLRTGDTVVLGHREVGEAMLDRYVLKRIAEEERANLSPVSRFHGLCPFTRP